MTTNFTHPHTQDYVDKLEARLKASALSFWCLAFLVIVLSVAMIADSVPRMDEQVVHAVVKVVRP